MRLRVATSLLLIGTGLGGRRRRCVRSGRLFDLEWAIGVDHCRLAGRTLHPCRAPRPSPGTPPCACRWPPGPSNIGTRFHNHLYDELGLDFVYKAFAPTDLAARWPGSAALGIRGARCRCRTRRTCIPLVDELDTSAAAIGSVNTIVNTAAAARLQHRLPGRRQLLAAHEVPADRSSPCCGSGGMAKAVVAALRDAGFGPAPWSHRNRSDGRALAEQYGFALAAGLGASRPRLMVNATPIGMAGGRRRDDLSFARERGGSRPRWCSTSSRSRRRPR